MDANAIVNLRGTVVAVNWKEGEPAADAELLDFGLERTMERRRTRLVRLASTASDSAEEVPREENAPNGAGAQCACSASQQVKELENEVRELRKRLEVAENMLDSYDMVKKLRKILGKTEKDPSPPVEAERVNIGGGVLVENTLLERLHSHCNGPTKFARHLLRGVFTLEEMRGKSLFGKGSNANKNAEVKEALDPVKVNAVIGVSIWRTKLKDGSCWAVLVVTEIMQRTQALESASEITFLDSTASCDESRATITVVLTATPVGALPIAVLMHNYQTTESYKTAFSLLRKKYPLCFGGLQTPTSFMTDNTTTEKAALLAVWPEATRLLCHFHVALAEWCWLHASSNKISHDEKLELMTALQKDAAEVLKQLHEEEWCFYSLASDNPHYTALEQVLAEM